MIKISMKGKILVAMSGGIDSAISAFLLKKTGFEIVGVYFQMKKRGYLNEYRRARLVAKKIGIKLIKKDVSGQFQKTVVDYFLRQYQKNQTPNPCVICNPQLKFKELFKLADELGISKVATGHYAKIEKKEIEGRNVFLLKKAFDKIKDQSYFLYRLKQRDLRRIIFPLGYLKKAEVKIIAEENGLIIEGMDESQDACFFAKSDGLVEFLNKHKLEAQEGNIINEEEKILGRHKGLIYYTQGQRQGLGLSGGPFYVIGKNAKKNLLIVSKNRKHEALENRKFKIKSVSLVSDEPEIGKLYGFKSRYQAKYSKGCFMAKNKDGLWSVALKGPQWAAAVGQSLVAYDGEKVIGGGIITAID